MENIKYFNFNKYSEFMKWKPDIKTKSNNHIIP